MERQQNSGETNSNLRAIAASMKLRKRRGPNMPAANQGDRLDELARILGSESLARFAISLDPTTEIIPGVFFSQRDADRLAAREAEQRARE